MATKKNKTPPKKTIRRTGSILQQQGKPPAKVKLVSEPIIDYYVKVQDEKVFGSWLTKIISGLDRERGRVDDDATLMKIVQIARKGIAQKEYAVLKKELQFSNEEWMHIFDASESTLRRLDKKDFLDKRHSEKLVDIAMLGDYGEAVFGSSDIFLDWLDTESPALDNIRPKELLDTSQGISIVKMELGRIDHGITL